jgi:hypothetical protein
MSCVGVGLYFGGLYHVDAAVFVLRTGQLHSSFGIEI